MRYNVYYGATIKDAKVIAVVDAPPFVLDGASTGCFRVSAVNADGESAPSAGMCL